MSIATALARLRQEGAVAAPSKNQIPSLLDDIKVHQIPRSQLAALAKNALHMLATVDNTLTSFVQPLLLSQPHLDRSTLPPHLLNPLSQALVRVAIRISPVFPLRAATKIFEWFIQGLQVSHLGSDQEVSAIFLSALPFHATQNFLRLTQAMLRGKKHPNWDWLQPVVKQQKPPSIHFLQHNCPNAVLHLLLKTASQTAAAGVTNTAQTSLIANLLVRRISSKPDRQLTLSVLDTCTILKKFRNDSKRPVITELLSALLVVISAALPSASEETATAMLQSASAIFFKAPDATPLSDTALTTIALAVTQSVNIPMRVATVLLRVPRFRLSLPRLHNLPIARAVYLATLLKFVSGLPSDLSTFQLLKDALTDDPDVCPDETVRNVLVALLNVFSFEEGDNSKTITSHLTDIVSHLSHGRRAGAVDIALREHFEKRVKKKTELGCYEMVDNAIAEAMSDTPFQILKLKTNKKHDGLSLYDGTLIGAMDHPEPVVRRLALKKLSEESASLGEDILEKGKGYPVKLLQIIRDDADVECVAKAVHCITAFTSIMNREKLLSTIAERYIAVSKAAPLKKSTKLGKGMRYFIRSLICVCLKLQSSGDLSVESLFIGLVIADLIPLDLVSNVSSSVRQLIPSCFAASDGQEADGSVCEHIRLTVSSKVEHGFLGVDRLLKNLVHWDVAWGVRIVKSWLGYLGKLDSRTNYVTTIHFIVNSLALLFEKFEKNRVDICEALMEKLMMLHNSELSELAFRGICDQIWVLVSRVERKVQFQEYVGRFFEEIGLLDTIAMMKRGCSHSGTEDSGEIRRVSLKWFVNICAVHNSEKVNREAMFVLVHALYADDPLSREVSRRLCKSGLPRSLRGKGTTNELSVLKLAASEVLDNEDIHSNRPELDEISKVLGTHVLPWCADPTGTTLPLATCVRARNTSEFDHLLRVILQRAVDPTVSVSERLLLLRALEGTNASGAKDQQKLLGLLAKHVEELSANDLSSRKCNECIARLTALLSAEQLSGMSIKAVASTVTSIVTKLSSIREATHTDERLPPQAEVVLVSVLARLFTLLSSSAKSSKNARNKILSQVFSFSSKSSIGGRAAQNLLDEVFDPVVPLLDVSIHLGKLSNMLPTGAKKSRTESRESPSSSHRFGTKVAMGAVRNLRKRVTKLKKDSGTHSASLHTLKAPLWNFVIAAMRIPEEEKVSVEDEIVFELENALDVLALLHSVNQSQGADNEFVDVKVIVDAVFYPNPGFEGEETALIAAVRRSALELVEVLAPHFGKQLQAIIFPVIEHLLGCKDSQRALNSLHRIVPALVASGCEFRDICKWLCTMAYDHAESKESFSEQRASVAACSRMNVSDSISGVVMCLQEISKILSASVGEQAAVQECSQFLLQVGQSSAEDLRTINCCSEELRCNLAAVHILHPKFFTKLLNSLRDSESGDAAAIEEALSSLFINLLGSPALSTRKNAIGAVLAILPLQSFGVCVTNALKTEDHILRTRTLEALTHRLNAKKVQWAYAWSFDNDFAARGKMGEVEVEKAFVECVGSALCDLLDEKAKVSVDIQQAVVSNLQSLSHSFGLSSRDSMLMFLPTLLKIVNCRRTEEAISHKKDEEQLVFLTSVLLCLASMMKTLRKRAAPFVPRLMEISVTILDVTYSQNESGQEVAERTNSALIALGEAAVRMCTSTLETNPKMFGRKTLQKISSLAVIVNTEVVGELLQFAVEKVPCNSAVIALSTASDVLCTNDHSHAGIMLVIRCIQKVIERMKKRELKIEIENITDIFFKCLDFRRKSYESILSREEKRNNDGSKISVFSSASAAVDSACTDAFLAMVLKLSESDFKILFNKFVQWSDGATLSEEANIVCNATGIDVNKNIMRAIPLYKISAALLNTLQSLMIPYFAHLLDSVLAIISMKRPEVKASTMEKGKKRKRSSVDEERTMSFGSQLSELQVELCDICIDNVTVFLRQTLDETVLTKAVILKIQDGIISSFDEVDNDYGRVVEAFKALALRIVAVGNATESREESRNVLMSLSRCILARSRNGKASVRKASLDCAKSLATTVGDEFLVTLPETMPVLADMIDDEDNTVQEAAKSFAEVMESLAGEPILEQLK